jgi:putative oxidoreductase
MNVALWIVQGLLAMTFLGIGYNHAFKIENMKPMPGMGWINRVPAGLMTFIGFAEMAGSIGVLVPAITGILPGLTPLAAAGLALIMLLAAIFHIPQRETEGRNIVTNLVLLALAAFVAYGRWVLVPLG